jgi:imidazolonepropionase-like amidohydrolase
MVRSAGCSWWPWLTAILLSVAASPVSSAEPETTTVLYAGATVIDGTGRSMGVTDILVRGERIAAVGRSGGLPAANVAGARVVDLRGRYVMPGLIDTHVHVATPPNRVQAEAVLRRNLYGGVTQVRDMADDLRSVAELARASQAGEIAAPDIAYAALIAGKPFFADPRVGAASRGFAPGTAPWMKAIDEQTNLREAITLARGTSASAIKVYADLTPPLIAAVAREAHRQHMMVWAHSAVFPTRPADVIAAGADSISHICYLAYQRAPVMLASYEDHTPVDEALLVREGDDPVMAVLFRDMLKRGTIMDATGSLFVQGDAERRAHPERRPLRCTGAAVIRLTRQAWRAGVPISTGTDHVGPAGKMWPDVHAELLFLAHDVGMPASEVIRSATLIGARAAGLERDMGTIETGKLANFLVLEKDPLADIDHIDTLVTTVKRGRAYSRSDFRPLTAEELKD